MNNRLFPRMCLVIPLIISFLFMPVNSVNAAGYSSDADYWRWWYIEHETDAITDGQGASAESIQNTDSGQTAGTVIYNQSGVTRGDFIDYVEEQYNTIEGYVEKSVDYYVDAVNHVYDSTVTAGTKAAYQTQKAVREVVDASGKVIVDVSGSDFWHSAYNSLFNNNGYKPQYSNVSDSGVNGTYNGNTFSVSSIGLVKSDDAFYNQIDSTPFTTVFQGITCYSSIGHLYQFGESITRGYYAGVWQITVNNNTCYAFGGSYANTRSEFTLNYDGYETTYYYVNVTFQTPAGMNTDDWKIYFNGNAENLGSNTNPVLQPSQCGFIVYNGDRIPVYTDPSQNPFIVNDDGTVDYNGNTYPIYIDPDEISPDGWLKILEFIDNEDETQNPYNPQGKPWNTQNDGSVLGGFFNNLITDIGNLFSGLIDKLKEIVNKIANFFNNFIDSIVNAIKKFIEIFIGDLDLDAMTDLDITNPFSMVQECYDLLLELLGVNIT